MPSGGRTACLVHPHVGGVDKAHGVEAAVGGVAGVGGAAGSGRGGAQGPRDGGDGKPPAATKLPPSPNTRCAHSVHHFSMLGTDGVLTWGARRRQSSAPRRPPGGRARRCAPWPRRPRPLHGSARGRAGREGAEGRPRQEAGGCLAPNRTATDCEWHRLWPQAGEPAALRPAHPEGLCPYQLPHQALNR